jgi:hypothetical protein
MLNAMRTFIFHGAAEERAMSAGAPFRRPEADG